MDYDRPRFLRRPLLAHPRVVSRRASLTLFALGRQFLVSQHQASVLSNLVAIALTLASPRLWILIKAFLLFAIDISPNCLRKRTITRDSEELPLTSRTGASFANNASPTGLRASQHTSNRPVNSRITEGEIQEVTRASHSELGAALRLIGNLWHFLSQGNIDLSTSLVASRRVCVKNMRIYRIVLKVWKNILRRPLDILTSLLLLVLFVAIFVAESTANVLSGNTVTNTTALVSSSKCTLAHWDMQPDAYAYTQLCYWAKPGTSGCTSFYNQSIAYTEKSKQRCPFDGAICAQVGDTALTFDTGLVDAKFVGINSAAHYQFGGRPLVFHLGLMVDIYILDSRNLAGYYITKRYGEAWLPPKPGR